jgi:glycosyltransferase involved in cell wall biosynthesis
MYQMKDHKRVLVFARHPSGGIRTYFRYVYGNSAMDDVRLSFVTPKSEELNQILLTLTNVEFNSESNDSVFALIVSLVGSLFSRKFDVIHSHGFTAGLIAVIPARILSIPHIITTHDVLLEPQLIGLKGKLQKWAVGQLLRLATVVNPVGRDAASNLLETYSYLNAPGKVREIQNGIDIDHFLIERKRDLRAEAGLASDAFLLGFFGRFMAQKGFRTLVDAVEIWNAKPDTGKVTVACFGWGGFIREEQASLRERNLDGYFHFFPNTDDMPAALRGVDAVVMPSRWEACPLLPMEAFVSGVPVIATGCIGLGEVTENTPVVSFEIGNAESLVDAILYFKEHREQITQEVREFRDEAAKRFDVTSTALLVRGLMDSIAPPIS